MGEGPVRCESDTGEPGTTRPSAAAVALGTGAAVATTVTGANAAPNTVGSVTVPATSPAEQLVHPDPDQYADQARGGALRRERVVRPLLRDLPVRGQHRRQHVPGQARHPEGERPVHHDHLERPDRPAADRQPERVQPPAAHPLPGPDLRPEPRLHAGAGSRSTAGRWTSSSRTPRPSTCTGQPILFGAARPGHGLLRRQHRHRAVELRAELRDERQQLRHHLRPVHARRAERDLRQRRRRLRGQPDHRRQVADAGAVERAEQQRPGHHLRRPRPRLRRLLGQQPHLDQPGRRR